jgi:hypothetical protein
VRLRKGLERLGKPLSSATKLIAEVTVSPAHFRAVAKIGFHYVLKMFPDLTGTETEFAPIRARPTQWMHILAVERTYSVILAHAQFFAGPGIVPPPYVIRIVRNPARIDSRREVRGHQFVVLDPAAGTGEMVDAEPAQFIWVP